MQTRLEDFPPQPNPSEQERQVPPSGGSFLSKDEQHQIILENLNFARGVVHKFGWFGQLNEDVEQAAYLGLAEAADRFDPAGGAEFQTLAYYWIRGKAVDVMRQRYPVKPKTMRRIRELERTEETLAQLFQRQPSIQELAAAMGIDEEKALQFKELARMLTPVTPSEDEERSARLGPESLPDPSVSVEDEVIGKIERNELAQKLHDGLSTLRERQRYVINLHYLGGMAIADLANELGVTFQAVNQSKQLGLKHLAVAMS